MNRKIFENYMHTEPDTLDKKYMFIVDNFNLALSIIDAGVSTVALQEDDDGFFSLDGLMECLILPDPQRAERGRRGKMKLLFQKNGNRIFYESE